MSCCDNFTIPTLCLTPPVCPNPLGYSFQNANLLGQGVLKGVVGSTVSFLGIVCEDGSITVTPDVPNGVINIQVAIQPSGFPAGWRAILGPIVNGLAPMLIQRLESGNWITHLQLP